MCKRGTEAAQEPLGRICHFVPMRATKYRSAFRSNIIPWRPANSSHPVIDLCYLGQKITSPQKGELLGGHSQVVLLDPAQVNLNHEVSSCCSLYQCSQQWRFLLADQRRPPSILRNDGTPRA